MYTVRMFFEKTGLARYISHLDLMRCFERALRRADIPFWYTEGFNPRPFLTFALPLSLGTAGLCEVVDIRLTEEDYPLERVTERMNACLADGLRVIETALPIAKPKEIAASRYAIRIACAGKTGAELAGELYGLLSEGTLTVTKLNKRKQPVETDIHPMIKAYAVSARGDEAELDVTLASGCTESCNPSLVLDAFAARCAESYGDAQPEFDLTRTAILDGELAPFA